MLSRQQLQVAFDKLDTDNSKFIDINELDVLCKLLMIEVDTKELTNLFDDIDVNHDGKISFEEFAVWWRLGRQSQSREVVKVTIKAKKTLNELKAYTSNFDEELYEGKDIKKGAKKTLNELKACTSNFDEELFKGKDIKKLFDIEFRDGKPSNNSEFDFKVNTTIDKDRLKEFKKSHPEMDFDLEKGNFMVLTLKCSDIDAAKIGFESFIHQLEMMLKDNNVPEELFKLFIPKIGVNGNKLILLFNFAGNPFFSLPEELLDDSYEHLKRVGANFHFCSSHNETFETIRTEEGFRRMKLNNRTHLSVFAAEKGWEYYMDKVLPIYLDGKSNIISIFDGFEFKLQFNGDERILENVEGNKNFQKRMSEMLLAQVKDNEMFAYFLEQHLIYLNDKQVGYGECKNLDECIIKWANTKGVKNFFAEENENIYFPFVKDFFNDMNKSVECDMKVDFVVSGYHLRSDFRSKGFGTVFQLMWQAIFEN